MKHFLTRMQSVFSPDGRFCGTLLRHARGFDAYDATGARVGVYPEDHLIDAAIARLRSIATERST